MKQSRTFEKRLLPAALAAALIIAPTAALADLSQGDVLGTTEEEIGVALENRGYVVEEIEFDGDVIEVDIAVNGDAMEIEVDAATGQVLSVEGDD
jgi:hypothetical protein